MIKFPAAHSCLCHGYLGITDLLLKARPYISSKKLQREIDRYLNAIIMDLERDANNYDIQNSFSPGLMTGSAGVALEMLRIIDSYSVPSVLSLE